MNNKMLKLICSVVLAVLMLGSIACAALVWFGPIGGEMTTLDGSQQMPVPVFTELLMGWIYIMLGFTAVVTLILALAKFGKNLATSPKKAMKPLVVILGLVVIFAVAWSFGTQDKLYIFGYEGSENYGPVAQMIDMVLYTIYALFVFIAATIVVGRIITVVKTNK